METNLVIVEAKAEGQTITGLIRGSECNCTQWFCGGQYESYNKIQRTTTFTSPAGSEAFNTSTGCILKVRRPRNCLHVWVSILTFCNDHSNGTKDPERAGEKNTSVYGVATDSYTFIFYHLNKDSKVRETRKHCFFITWLIIEVVEMCFLLGWGPRRNHHHCLSSFCQDFCEASLLSPSVAWRHLTKSPTGRLDTKAVKTCMLVLANASSQPTGTKKTEALISHFAQKEGVKDVEKLFGTTRVYETMDVSWADVSKVTSRRHPS